MSSFKVYHDGAHMNVNECTYIMNKGGTLFFAPPPTLGAQPPVRL